MAQLDNPRHEAFAQAMSTGMSASDAYRKTYGQRGAKNVNDISSKLSAKVSKRVFELQGLSATDTTLSLIEKRELLAPRARDPDVSNQDLIAIIMADAKLAGELVDKAEMKLVNAPSLADLIAAQKRMPELQGLC